MKQLFRIAVIVPFRGRRNYSEHVVCKPHCSFFNYWPEEGSWTTKTLILLFCNCDCTGSINSFNKTICYLLQFDWCVLNGMCWGQVRAMGHGQPLIIVCKKKKKKIISKNTMLNASLLDHRWQSVQVKGKV